MMATPNDATTPATVPDPDPADRTQEIQNVQFWTQTQCLLYAALKGHKMAVQHYCIAVKRHNEDILQ
ncbi:hypothetical protein AOLI_G00080690 [Acnodon oligacanthus]